MDQPSKVSMKDVLKLIVNRLGASWKYLDVTSAKLSQWSGWTTGESKRWLNKLVKSKYAIQTGREGRHSRVESYGTTCVTYSLVSDRVNRLLAHD